MSDYNASRILKPDFFKITHVKKGSPNREPYVIGFDSEAENGYPFLFQFAHPDGTCDLIDIPFTEEPYNPLFLFVDYLAQHCKRKDTEYIVFGFNLGYEYTQLFRDLNPELINSTEFQLGTLEEPSITDTGVQFVLRAFNEKRYSFTIEFGKTKRRVKVLDAMAFFPMSLNNAASAINIGAKAEKPEDFSRAASRTESFIAYAKQDAILTQKLGDYIVELHRKYDVAMTMTAPQFASRTFRRQFLKTEIVLPHLNLEQYGLDSYHGGKNGFYLHEPKEFGKMFHIDIRSAYPEAMRQLPDIEKAKFSFVEEYRPNVHAIWEIVGKYTPCKYRCLMGKTTWLQEGVIQTRITSYELDSVLEHGELELLSCSGYVMTGPVGTGALVDYVDTFYNMKRYAANAGEKTAAKLFLNSLYGKFFQKVPLGKVGFVNVVTQKVIMSDPNQEYDYIAGGLYHPPIASLITGYVRAKIHGMEHKYKSIMTSTDGLFAYKGPDISDIGEELGQLDAKFGTLKIWKERLYIFTYFVDGKKKVIAALHGWRGTIEQLNRVPLMAGNIYHYHAKAMITLRMSLREMRGTRYQPGQFVEMPFALIIEGTT